MRAGNAHDSGGHAVRTGNRGLGRLAPVQTDHEHTDVRIPGADGIHHMSRRTSDDVRTIIVAIQATVSAQRLSLIHILYQLNQLGGQYFLAPATLMV